MKFNVEEQLGFSYSDKPNSHNIIEGDNYRISIINSRLIRFEYSKFDFVDKPTQKILNRNFGDTKYSVSKKAEMLTIETEHLLIRYDQKPFSREGLSIIQKKALDQDTIWRFGDRDEKNLKGTARTLDNINGRVELEDGINSLNGYGVIDDSRSLLLNSDGRLSVREETIDLYYFGYSLDFKQAVQDLYKLTGSYPTIPKYMLGNWWSRFWEYSEQTVMDLVEKFEENAIPLSVFIFDMDWHLVDIGEEYGSGWTGFTWNKKLFPDPKRMIDWLHARGIKVALNLHPADGFRAFEEEYPQIARDLNIDPNTKTPIAFDVANSEFMQSYFKNFIEKNEKLGVDFWWLDWQQGDVSSVKGLDPLWMLNHQHFLHHGLHHDTAVTFSRYAGIGSHRYPIGFSGDTHMTWETLAFQPEFTATSANVGYNYWSHDIGGHMLGVWDEELFRRWLQFGVFSPIMRLHSGKSVFVEKEPWENSDLTKKVASKYMNLRAELVDFIYSENCKGSKTGSQLIEPIYFNYPTDKNVYNFKNQYMFGNQMLIAPVVEPKDKSTGLSKTKIYLPAGTWYDMHGFKYTGEHEYNYYTRELDYPVFRQAASIIPLTRKKTIEINIVPGNGIYTFVQESETSDIEMSLDADVLTVSYSCQLAKEKEISIKSNPAFELSRLEIANNNETISQKFKVRQLNLKYTRKMIEKTIKDFDLDMKTKYQIEENQYILDDQADKLERINAVLTSEMHDEQREALIALLML